MKITNDIIRDIKQKIHPTMKNKKNLNKLVNSYFPGGKAYGTRNPEVRKIARKYLKELKKDKDLLIKIAEELWKDGHIETRIIASIFIGAPIGNSRSIKIIKKWVPTLDNWANADLLMCETKKYWINNPKETLEYSEKLIRSKNPWDRRFGLIILIFPVRKRTILKGQAMKIARKLKDDKEKYVRKGYIWLMDQISKS